MVCRGGSCESADLREPPSPPPRDPTPHRSPCFLLSPLAGRHPTLSPTGAFLRLFPGLGCFRPDVLIVNALAHQPWLQFRLPQGDLPRLPSSLDHLHTSPQTHPSWHSSPATSGVYCACLVSSSFVIGYDRVPSTGPVLCRLFVAVC